MNECEKYTEDWIGTVTVNGSLEGASGKHLAIKYTNGCAIAQLCFDLDEKNKVW